MAPGVPTICTSMFFYWIFYIHRATTTQGKAAERNEYGEELGHSFSSTQVLERRGWDVEDFQVPTY